LREIKIQSLPNSQKKRALNFQRRSAEFLGLKGGLVPRRSYNLIFITHFISIKIIIILLSEIYLYFSKKNHLEMLRIKRHFTINRFLDRLIREPMDNEEEEFFDDNDSDVLDNEIGSRHNFQR
jgi:hypothetical protein